MPKRTCVDCGQARKELQGTRRRKCDRCQRAIRRATARRAHVGRTYGLTPEDHDSLAEFQNGLCAICDQPRPYNLAVDHDHATGLVRGLLCKRCNKLLRDVRDNRELLISAATYLKHPPAQMLHILARCPTEGE